jgi:hypothetical protein
LLEEDLESEEDVVEEVVVESFVLWSSLLANAPAMAAEIESSSEAEVAIVCGSELVFFGLRLLGFLATAAFSSLVWLFGLEIGDAHIYF